MGKTSIESRLNLPGKWAWFLMEIPGPLVILYCLATIPPSLGLTVHDLSWTNWTLAGMYITHYIYRAIAYPILQPTMSPIHALPFLGAAAFNVINALSIGGWIAGYGPRHTVDDWAGALYRIEVGLVIWGWSWLAVMFHDDDLREIRRAALRMQREKAEKEGKKIEGVDKVYMIPKNGLFHFVLHAHYFCEWFEWLGFWVVGGLDFVPARNFLMNEVCTMLPRALGGRRWYIERFGEEKIGGRKAVIPGLL